MAHYAEIDQDNKVIRVLVVANDVLTTPDGTEDEALGKAFCQSLFGGNWVQTSYNGKFRKMYAGIGYKYITTEDVFLPGEYSSTAEYEAAMAKAVADAEMAKAVADAAKKGT